MLKSLFDDVMERRSTQMLEEVGDWMPASGKLLDLGSGTGHVAERLERQPGVEVVPVDVCDMHVKGRPPIVIEGDVPLPFPDKHFSGALLFFMLGYPADPIFVLSEASRVSDGPVIVVQTVCAGRFGCAWHRIREFAWTVVAFHVSKIIGYVPRHATFTMNTRRFYTRDALHGDVRRAGLRIVECRDRPVLPRRALIVTSILLAPR